MLEVDFINNTQTSLTNLLHLEPGQSWASLEKRVVQVVASLNTLGASLNIYQMPAADYQVLCEQGLPLLTQVLRSCIDALKRGQDSTPFRYTGTFHFLHTGHCSGLNRLHFDHTWVFRNFDQMLALFEGEYHSCDC